MGDYPHIPAQAGPPIFNTKDTKDTKDTKVQQRSSAAGQP
jgi:hypothetical protein